MSSTPSRWYMRSFFLFRNMRSVLFFYCTIMCVFTLILDQESFQQHIGSQEHVSKTRASFSDTNNHNIGSLYQVHELELILFEQHWFAQHWFIEHISNWFFLQAPREGVYAYLGLPLPWTNDPEWASVESGQLLFNREVRCWSWYWRVTPDMLPISQILAFIRNRDLYQLSPCATCAWQA